MKTLEQKQQILEETLRGLQSVAVAFSAGVDSTFLLKTAQNVLGDRVLAVTARSHSFPERECRAAEDFCIAEGIRQVFIDSEELEIAGFRDNPKNRCYLCKTELFTKIRQVAEEQNMAAVVEGSNMDDLGDYRPGLMAVAELGIKSPLRDAGLTKEEIRTLSHAMGLPTWNKPAFACLASRFAYGETITEEKLSRIDRAEQWLLDRGFSQVRVRVHGELARIEILPEEFSRLLGSDNAKELTAFCKALGFIYVTLDLEGYTTGSMNRTLEDGEHSAP